jgi:Acyl-CoA carboxylase epsilon subunit
MGTQWQETTGMPAHLVRDNVSPDELSAAVALVAILATASNDGDQGQAERQRPGSGRYPQSQWSSPRRMVRMTHPHGPGGWRASALPR